MKAIVQEAYGSADVLELRDVDKPLFGDDEVLVRVHAAGVNPGVWHLMTGVPYLMRILGAGLFKPKNSVAGQDVAGRVEAVGNSVTMLRPGDEVFGTCKGSFAEYSFAREDRFVSKPINLSFKEAAGRSRCRSPRRSGRKLPASAAQRRRIWCDLSALTMLLITPVRISPTVVSTTMSSWTLRAIVRCHTSDAPSPPRELW